MHKHIATLILLSFIISTHAGTIVIINDLPDALVLKEMNIWSENTYAHAPKFIAAKSSANIETKINAQAYIIQTHYALFKKETSHAYIQITKDISDYHSWISLYSTPDICANLTEPTFENGYSQATFTHCHS